MRCAISFDQPLNPYAMAVHHAAHAFAACLFEMEVTEISSSYGGRQGMFEVEGEPDLDHRSVGINRIRHAAEKRAIVLLAGAAAQVRGTGTVAFGYEDADQTQVFDLLGAIEPEPVTSEWFSYLRERTRVLVANEVAWRLISEITGSLLLRGHLGGDAVRRIATAFVDRIEAMPESNVVEVPVLGRWPTL